MRMSSAPLTGASELCHRGSGRYASQWMSGDARWDIGVPELSPREAVRRARAEHDDARRG